MQLLQELGKAYQALAQYDCQISLDLFSAIPPQHYNTGWVLCQVGRAHFELSDYQKVCLERYRSFRISVVIPAIANLL